MMWPKQTPDTPSSHSIRLTSKLSISIAHHLHPDSWDVISSILSYRIIMVFDISDRFHLFFSYKLLFSGFDSSVFPEMSTLCSKLLNSPVKDKYFCDSLMWLVICCFDVVLFEYRTHRRRINNNLFF